MNLVQRLKLVSEENEPSRRQVSSLTEDTRGRAGAFYNCGVGWAAWQSPNGEIEGREESRGRKPHLRN